MRLLTNAEMATIKGGEPVTLAAVMTILVIAIVTVIVYKLFTSKAGSTTIPGGFKFEWK
ncbi:MAG: hypothetical protein BWX57_00746 [Tenericutes bacterium ADurb.Bin024]|nr:MAG: hypothetical protein BWX57_00746 [Tenericutes bacterium ADurb.Bin024]